MGRTYRHLAGIEGVGGVRKVILMCLTILSLVLVISGCGLKTQATVLKDLQNLKGNLPPYQVQAQMSVHTSANSVQNYWIETKFKSPTQYKITLANANKQVNQIVIRNPEGLFVVSPQTKKAFRFQGEWVENQGQAYLYHLLLDRLLQSQNPEYSKNKDGTLSFTLPMAASTPWVVKQSVTLDEKTLFPTELQYMDKEGKAVVTVKYQPFKRNVNFLDSEFQTASVLTSAGQDLPVLAEPKDHPVIEPEYLPEGAKKLSEVRTDSGVLLRYETPMGMITIQEKDPKAEATSTLDPNGKIYDLYGLPAVASVSDAGTVMQWTNRGVEYTLISKIEIPTLWKIAKSMIQ